MLWWNISVESYDSYLFLLRSKRTIKYKECQWVTASPYIAVTAGAQLHWLVDCFIICETVISKSGKQKFIISCFCVPPTIMVREYGMTYRNHAFKENIKGYNN